jgi:iron complex transport system substrate-binding protein
MAPGEPDWADRILSHPALRALRSFTRTEGFPETLMFCGGPVMIPALAALVQARRDAERGRSQ